MNKLRITKVRKEIFGLMSLALNLDEDVVLWDHTDPDHPIMRARISAIDTEKGYFLIVPYEDIKLTKDKVYSFYLKADDQMGIFKTKITEAPGKVAKVKIPSAIKTVEKRAMRRLEFKKLQKYKNLYFTRYDSNMKKYREAKVRVVDLSLSGVGVVASFQYEYSFPPGCLIEITQIGDVIIPKPVLATIRYIRKKKVNKSHIYLRIGIEFDQKLDAEFMIKTMDFNDKDEDKAA